KIHGSLTLLKRKTDCPHWPGNTPGWAENLSTYHQRAIGVKVHWRRTCITYLFLTDCLITGGAGGGANLIVECLRRVFNDLHQEFQKLPPVLYVQFDNCSENKNRTVFAYLAHLVELNIFQKVKAGFLAVGHTHEDIDAYFSVISRHLRRTTVLTPQE